MADLLDDLSSDSETEVGLMPLERKVHTYACFAKTQTEQERAEWLRESVLKQFEK